MSSDNEVIDGIVGFARRIAVVGLSARPDRPSYDVAGYLQRQGLDIVPVNPAVQGEILGVRVYPDLTSIPGDIDLVDVFRRSDAVLPLAEETVRRGGIRAFWMQQGVVNPEAARLLEVHGILVVQDRCLKLEHLARCG